MAPPNQKKTTQTQKLSAKSRKNTGSLSAYQVKNASGNAKVNAAINNLVKALTNLPGQNTQSQANKNFRRTTASVAKATATKAAAAKNPSKAGAEGPKKRAGSTRRSSGTSANAKYYQKQRLSVAKRKK